MLTVEVGEKALHAVNDEESTRGGKDLERVLSAGDFGVCDPPVRSMPNAA